MYPHVNHMNGGVGLRTIDPTPLIVFERVSFEDRQWPKGPVLTALQAVSKPSKGTIVSAVLCLVSLCVGFVRIGLVEEK